LTIIVLSSYKFGPVTTEVRENVSHLLFAPS